MTFFDVRVFEWLIIVAVSAILIFLGLVVSWLIALCAIMAVIIASIAESYGRTASGWWFYGLLLWPVAFIHILVIGEGRGTVRGVGMRWLLSVTCVALLTVGYFATGLVVIPRIGAVPEGRTVWMWRLNGSPFLEAPDAWCIRNDSPTLMCRMVILGAISKNADHILGRFPYSENLERLAIEGSYRWK